jgi:PAS domain S-box-containing protein
VGIDPDEQLIDRRAPPADEAFRLLVSGVREYAIYMLDPTGVIVTWNDGARWIKGYEEHEIIGKHFSVFFEQADVDAGKPEWELAVAERDGQLEDEGWRVRRDGTRFWANVIITALRDDSGLLRGFGKVIRDLTDRQGAAEQRREAERLRENAEQLSHLERAKSAFLNVASHELRKPLTVLGGYLSMFEDGTLSADKLQSIVPVLSREVRQMVFLVDRMLETARLEADRFELRPELLDVGALVEGVVDGYRQFVRPQHSLLLLLPEERIDAYADRRLLETAVSNLIDNAIKYSPDGGPVSCEVARRRRRVLISVEDRGLGIPEEAMGDLFSRFGRIVTTENAHIDGTGLGLHLARRIARLHGGNILVRSREGHGSRFTLAIPPAPATA